MHLSWSPCFCQNLDTAWRHFFIYLFDIQKFEYVGEKARWVIRKFNITVKLLSYNKNFVHTNVFDFFFKWFQWPSCEWFSNRYLWLVKIGCDTFIQKVYLHFEKHYLISKNNTLFINLLWFDVLPSDELNATQTATRIGKHVPISVSKYSKLINEPIFL